MTRFLKAVGLYTLGFLAFPYSWLREQPGALRYAYLDSVAEAHDRVKKMYEEDPNGSP